MGHGDDWTWDDDIDSTVKYDQIKHFDILCFELISDFQCSQYLLMENITLALAISSCMQNFYGWKINIY